MRLVILHYHIFKNAGSTVEDILDHSFGDRFGTMETSSDGGLVSHRDLIRYVDERPGLQAFSSHQIRYPLPETPGYMFFDICFLRDPLDRLRSFYDYFRQRPNPGDPMSALANRCDLGDFVAGMVADHSLFVRNNQVNLLACGGDSDEPNEGDLDLAVRRMRAASFPGVVDCFEQSVVAGQDALRCAFPELDCARPAVNVSRGMEGTLAGRIAAMRDACAPDVYEELLRITELDRRLVDLARIEVLRRFEIAVARKSRLEARRGHDSPPRKSDLTPGGGSFSGATIHRFIQLAPFWRELAGGGRATLFDSDYYGASLLHFLAEGGRGRSPHPLFDPAFYLRKYPDVAAAGVNPLFHYLKYGRAQLRRPHPVFDPVFYLERNPDVLRAGLDPLLHYIRNGAAEDRKPHPLFDPVYYRKKCAESPANALVHFLSCDRNAASPHPLFDCEAYLEAHPDVKGNPLVHYLESADITGAALTPGIDIEDVRLPVKDADAWAVEPQQLPFLQAVGAAQIRAQLKGMPAE